MPLPFPTTASFPPLTAPTASPKCARIQPCLLHCKRVPKQQPTHSRPLTSSTSTWSRSAGGLSASTAARSLSCFHSPPRLPCASPCTAGPSRACRAPPRSDAARRPPPRRSSPARCPSSSRPSASHCSTRLRSKQSRVSQPSFYLPHRPKCREM